MTRGNAWQALQNEVREQHALFDRKAGACIDAYTQAGNRVYCGKGCRGCCNLAVNCTFTEALPIAAELTGPQAARVKSHALLLLEQIRETTDLKSYLRMHRQKTGFCPLLSDDGTCSVYAERPFSCRSLLSTKESRWCGVDFGELSASAKAAFIESLDREAVSFPMHYLYATQDLGQQFEARASLSMAARFGFSLSGNLPFLVYLELEHRISGIIPQGPRVTARFLEQTGLFHPFLVMPEGI